MWILYGVEKVLDDVSSMGTKRDALATFDSEKEGLEYVEASKLATYNKVAPYKTPELQFKENSLLNGFHLSHLEPKNTLPHNPKMSE